MITDTQTLLQATFGLEDFRPGQKEIISRIIQGGNTLVFMPTGGGKSLTYQLPALVREGVAVVVSPLISLQNDQVDSLRAKGLNAVAINSQLPDWEKQHIYDELLSRESRIKFVYIAPERLLEKQFMQVLSTIKIALFAIDEAHCISQWGHDFRPSYLKLKSVIEGLGKHQKFPVVGLTATATEKVRNDMVARLGLIEYEEFIFGFERKNIAFIVREISKKEEKLEKVLEIIQKTPPFGIVYCSSVKDVSGVYQYLLSRKVSVGIYTGELESEIRNAEQQKFMDGVYDVMVATNAFGMGIDKKDVRYVIHYNLPGSIENYYQEVGRAGRDGRNSYGVVLASYRDVKIQEFFIENSYPDKELTKKLYDTLYRDLPLGKGAGKIITASYSQLAIMSGIESDMKVGSILRMLEKYDIIQRVQGSGVRGVELLLSKREFDSLPILWGQQLTLQSRAKERLDTMTQLLFRPRCRKRFILEYFGDTKDLQNLEKNCGMCDYCIALKQFMDSGGGPLIPIYTVFLVLECIKRYDEKFGMQVIGEILGGISSKKILDWHLDASEDFGVLQTYTKEAIIGIIEALKSMSYIFITPGKYPKLGLTRDGVLLVEKPSIFDEKEGEFFAHIAVKLKGVEIFR